MVILIPFIKTVLKTGLKQMIKTSIIATKIKSLLKSDFTRKTHCTDLKKKSKANFSPKNHDEVAYHYSDPFASEQGFILF